ncbi:unknown; predicted coding region [Mycoplasmopsis pulmonis]|uniref:Uncharacterized protein n=1 Tax=Mycoplasmopsis pulmonis (strain UAB CTIP) TaxID=272635 RepID=Q98R89_MYCPU|nr:hypothetical protein [Mycoplasmopsis pulmonis]CAC13294.1 unknown; predicted coding region [Mycoplasmopsis pulmonis]VEU67884.1 Uncharacterised protein [Mycoplasmopsis pulmonis]
MNQETLKEMSDKKYKNIIRAEKIKTTIYLIILASISFALIAILFLNVYVYPSDPFYEDATKLNRFISFMIAGAIALVLSRFFYLAYIFQKFKSNDKYYNLKNIYIKLYTNKVSYTLTFISLLWISILSSLLFYFLRDKKWTVGSIELINFKNVFDQNSLVFSLMGVATILLIAAYILLIIWTSFKIKKIKKIYELDNVSMKDIKPKTKKKIISWLVIFILINTLIVLIIYFYSRFTPVLTQILGA